jgi:hypothetical protein
MGATHNCELDGLIHANAIKYGEWSAGGDFARKLHAAHLMGRAISGMKRLSSRGGMVDRMADA